MVLAMEEPRRVEFFKDFTDYFARKASYDLEKIASEERMIEGLTPHEYITYFSGIRDAKIIAELRAIKWLLFAVIVILLSVANGTLDAGWWHKGWW